MSGLNTAAVTVEPGNFLFHVNVAKVDKEKREVFGIVTAEVVDKQGDIVDYETAKKFFADEALWPGNIREMHQPVAVGKKVSVEFDDANKTIGLTSKVSKGAPETWEKVLDGTLSMYSIGGSGDRKIEQTADGKAVKRLFLKQLAEVSLVDNGANPLAKFDIVKSVDGKLTDAQPAEEVEPVAKAEATPTDTKTEETVPDATKTLIAKRGDVLTIITKFVASDAGKTSPRAAALAQKTVDLIAKTVDVTDVAKGGYPEPYDIDRALNAISYLERLMADEFWEARYATSSGGDASVELAQVSLLKSAIDSVMLFLMSEYNEQFTAPPSADGEVTAPYIDLSDVAAEMAITASNVMKAGARHSKADMEMVQKMHDAAITLGAKCIKEEDGDDAEKVAKAAATESARKAAAIDKQEEKIPAVVPAVVVEKAVEVGEVQKLTTELGTAKTQLKEQGEQIAKLNEALEAIKQMARPGGPVARVVPGLPVEKALGAESIGGGTGSKTPEADTMVKALQHLSRESGSEEVRRQAALEIVKIQHATDSGRIEFKV